MRAQRAASSDIRDKLQVRYTIYVPSALPKLTAVGKLWRDGPNRMGRATWIEQTGEGHSFRLGLGRHRDILTM